MTIPIETVLNVPLIIAITIGLMMVIGAIISFSEEILGSVFMLVGGVAVLFICFGTSDKVGAIEPSPSQDMFEISQSTKHPHQSLEEAIEDNYGLHYEGNFFSSLKNDKMADFTKGDKSMKCKVHAQYNDAETQLGVTVKCVEGDKMVTQKPLKNAEYSTQNTKDS